MSKQKKYAIAIVLAAFFVALSFIYTIEVKYKSGTIPLSGKIGPESPSLTLVTSADVHAVEIPFSSENDIGNKVKLEVLTGSSVVYSSEVNLKEERTNRREDGAFFYLPFRFSPLTSTTRGYRVTFMNISKETRCSLRFPYNR